MLLSSLGDAPFPDHRGRTLAFDLSSNVTALTLGLINAPRVSGGRIRVELFLRDAEGNAVPDLPKWPMSERSGTPARLVSLERQSGTFELPVIELPATRGTAIEISLRSRKRDLTFLKQAGTKLYVTAEDSRNALRTSIVRSAA